MTEVYVKYNPYTVKTVFRIDGVDVDKLSDFYYKQEDVRLQEWIEPSGEWEGFYKELYKYLNSSEAIKLKFIGTELDYEDLIYAYGKYGSVFERIDFEFASENNHKNRLEIIKKKFDELKKSPVEDLHDPQIQEAFEKALSSEFEILVVAPMSSGKSTLINAVLGTDLLPALNVATTATVARIKDIDEADEFTVFCKDREGNVLADGEVASHALIMHLNAIADEEDNIEYIQIQGNIPNIPSDKVNIVFVDTPGGNNSQDDEHEEVMKRAIKDENKGMILFVFNYTQLETDDCDAILSLAAQAMQNSTTGKQARDRFVFVCNKMDAQDPEKEPYDQILNRIHSYLGKKGILEPNLFLTCADVCKLIRMEKSGTSLSESDDDRLDGYLKPFNRKSRQLFKYASIPQNIKDEFQRKVDEIAETGDKRNLESAEINSGIPALEAAIRIYIDKYAEAIKIKTVHDIFMRKVNELDMEAKSRKKWTESKTNYEKMRKELADKENAYAKDINLKEFKIRVDRIKGDYEKIEEIRDKLAETIKDIAGEYPQKIEKEEAEELLKRWHMEMEVTAERAQSELGLSFEDCVYKQCKEIFQQYRTYILELDKSGLLNIGDYSFKKIGGFDTFKMDELTDISEGYTKTETISIDKIPKKGLVNAVKRFFGNEDGWKLEERKGEFVSLHELIVHKLTELEQDLFAEIAEELNRAKRNEEGMKSFVKKELGNIDEKIRNEYKKIREATEDVDELNDIVLKNEANMKWLSAFVDEMETLLDV